MLLMLGKPLDFDLLLDINTIEVLGSVCITCSRDMTFEVRQPVFSVLYINGANLYTKFNEVCNMVCNLDVVCRSYAWEIWKLGF